MSVPIQLLLITKIFSSIPPCWVKKNRQKEIGDRGVQKIIIKGMTPAVFGECPLLYNWRLPDRLKVEGCNNRAHLRRNCFADSASQMPLWLWVFWRPRIQNPFQIHGKLYWIPRLKTTQKNTPVLSRGKMLFRTEGHILYRATAGAGTTLTVSTFITASGGGLYVRRFDAVNTQIPIIMAIRHKIKYKI